MRMKIKILNFLSTFMYGFLRYFYYLKKNNVSFKSAYFIPILLGLINPNITPETEPIITYSFSMFTLSLIILICFFNIMSYILSIYLINKYDIKSKFPSFKRYIIFYSTTNKIFLIIEVIIAFFFA